ncbi:nickel pincer cofactor biosynthesis protein LarB [Methanocaldococcus indicus]|uniref:nickel pincer cofactor biosynthesis protein LarB n=1 Tax=Methanocaldococcus indicus TaxID=213231 RepID=UPI003C6D7312
MGESLRDILLDFKKGKLDIDEVEKLIKLDYIEKLEKFKLDINRELRTGIPEVVYGKGKCIDEIIEGTINLAKKNGKALATKIYNIEELKEKIKNYNEDLDNYTIKINEKAKTLTIIRKDYLHKNRNVVKGCVGIITAGTADIPIAEEAKETLDFLGVRYITSYDVGVAGIHRLFPILREMIINKVSVIIVIAGMEGALPSVVSSLVDVPVIGVPTSTATIEITPLLSMLHSCSPGLAVVNIDNGFGAATFAYLILKVKDL